MAEISRKANEQSSELAPHYKKQEKEGKQHWDRMWDLYREAWFVGNITKYVERYRDKNGVKDLIKARHYLDKLIELEEQDANISVQSENTGDAQPVCSCGKPYSRDLLLSGVTYCEDCDAKFKQELADAEENLRRVIRE